MRHDRLAVLGGDVERATFSEMSLSALEKLMAKKRPQPQQHSPSKKAAAVDHGDRSNGRRRRSSTATAPASGPAVAGGGPAKPSLKTKVYLPELARLQIELVKLQEWIRHAELKVVVIFEGRDAAGKGGAIKRITEGMNPRVARVVALPAPDRA